MQVSLAAATLLQHVIGSYHYAWLAIADMLLGTVGDAAVHSLVYALATPPVTVVLIDNTFRYTVGEPVHMMYKWCVQLLL
jgi:hypothetical protein